jgi:hypothetical protein
LLCMWVGYAEGIDETTQALLQDGSWCDNDGGRGSMAVIRSKGHSCPSRCKEPRDRVIEALIIRKVWSRERLFGEEDGRRLRGCRSSALDGILANRETRLDGRK